MNKFARFELPSLAQMALMPFCLGTVKTPPFLHFPHSRGVFLEMINMRLKGDWQ